MYFDKFPLLTYLKDLDGEVRRQLVTDVLRRVQIKTLGKEESTFFINYDMKDGDTPESISHRLYDSTSFFWVVLMVNDALNPYYDMPLDSISLENYVRKKYDGKYFYLVDPSDEKKVSGLTFAPDETIYSSSNVQDDFGTTQENFAVRARVVSHEPTLARVFVDGGEHTYFNTDKLIGVIRGSDVHQAKITRIEDGMFALHHFGAGSTITYNPLSSVTGDAPLGLTATSGSYAAVGPQFYETKLGVYLGISGARNAESAINNFEHETNENEKRRSIKLVHPDFIQDVVASFEQLMQN